jgi:hypothetical protein
MKKATFFCLVLTLLFATMAFECGRRPPNEGFYIHTTFGTFGPLGIPVQILDPHRRIVGNHVEDLYGLATGTRLSLGDNAVTDSGAFYAVPEGRAPAVWRLGELDGTCANQTFQTNINLGQDFSIICDTTCFFVVGPNCPGFHFLAEPSYIDVTNPPSTVSIIGSGMDGTYGMPYVGFYDPQGNVLAEGRATQMAADGTWISSPTPGLFNIYSSDYWAIVRNVRQDGSLQVIGVARIYIDNYQPPPEGCNPTPEQVNSCESGSGYWDYSDCSCHELILN